MLTRADWQSCSDPEEMLRSLGDRVSDRKARLFACGCLRRISEAVADVTASLGPLAFDTISASERLADGLILSEDLQALSARLPDFVRCEDDTASQSFFVEAQARVWMAIHMAAHRGWSNRTGADPVGCSREAAAAWGVWAVEQGRAVSEAEAERAERLEQVNLVRELFGQLYHDVRVEPAWLDANGGRARFLAQDIYHGRRFAELPVLAEALVAAGCDNPDLLGHLRSAAGHALGCWALDAVLGFG